MIRLRKGPERRRRFKIWKDLCKWGWVMKTADLTSDLSSNPLYLALSKDPHLWMLRDGARSTPGTPGCVQLLAATGRQMLWLVPYQRPTFARVRDSRCE